MTNGIAIPSDFGIVNATCDVQAQDFIRLFLDSDRRKIVSNRGVDDSVQVVDGEMAEWLKATVC